MLRPELPNEPAAALVNALGVEKASRRSDIPARAAAEAGIANNVRTVLFDPGQGRISAA